MYLLEETKAHENNDRKNLIMQKISGKCLGIFQIQVAEMISNTIFSHKMFTITFAEFFV